MSVPTIAVATANSKSGLAFIEHLFAKEGSGLKEGKFKLKGILRDPANAKTVVDKVAPHLVAGETPDKYIQFHANVDAADTKTVEDALRGVDIAFLVTPLAGNRGTLERNMIQAAHNVGVQYITIVTSWTAPLDDDSFRDEFFDSEQLAEKLFGNRAVVLRPGYFFTNFLDFAGSIAHQNAFYLPAKDARLGLIHPDDIGAVGAEVTRQFAVAPSFDKSLTGKTSAPASGSARYIRVIGREALTSAQVAALFSEVLQREIKYVDVPIETMTANLRAKGAPETLVHFLIALWREIHNGKDSYMAPTGETAQILGKTREFRDWVVENKDVFVKSP